MSTKKTKSIKLKYPYFAENIKKLRKSNGLTQKEMGARTALSQASINGWEKKTANPSTLAILNICKEFDLTKPALCYEPLDENKVPQLAKVDELPLKHRRLSKQFHEYLPVADASGVRQLTDYLNYLKGSLKTTKKPDKLP